MTNYKFKPGAGFNVDAQIAGEHLETLRESSGGILTPQVVVNDSRPEEAPLHPVFEWDDELAAEGYRRAQARNLIASVRIIREEDPEEEGDAPVEKQEIAYVNVRPSDDKPRGYITTAKAMSEEESRQQVLADAFKALQSLRVRYGHLTELAHIFEAIDDLAGVGV